ncbi:PIR protein, putative [Plasmodium sp. gorilla clade G1]|nr:PIR protein, putative [Plasmodium sp. gorilla clade G1]
MKLNYSKILLFYIPLNILAYNKNKTYITPYTQTTTSRLLRECDLYVSNYDNDTDMISVKEIFDGQTSQRFEEYNERMQVKRKKCKEQCEKDIQQIIVKDKVQKSLEERIEKCCLKCGCGLGGVAAGVGIIGPVSVSVWEIGAKAMAIKAAEQSVIDAGVNAAITQIKMSSLFSKPPLVVEWTKFIKAQNYGTVEGLVEAVKEAMASIQKPCPYADGTMDKVCNAISYKPDVWLGKVANAGQAAATAKSATAETAELAKVGDTSFAAYSAIGYSVTAILIIILVMVIIYLILRYRRKKKINKKAQYTKLLIQ